MSKRSFIAHPALFSALATSGEGDSDLSDGMHVRALPAAAGLPLAPLLVCPLSTELVDVPVHWPASGLIAGQPDLDQARGELHGRLAAAAPDHVCLLGLEAEPEAGGRIDELALVRLGRLVASRSLSPFCVAAPGLLELRVRGRGRFRLRALSVTDEQVIDRLFNLQLENENVLAMPVREHRWYAGGRGPDEPLRRVQRGAPLRLGPADQPDGPFDALSPDAEVARIESLRADLDDLLATTLGAAEPPWSAHSTRRLPADRDALRAKQTTRLTASAALRLQALDPSIGRYLGWVSGPLRDPREARYTAWAVGGVFAIDRTALLYRRKRSSAVIGSVLPIQDELERRLLERVFEHFPDLRERAALVRAHGRELRFLVALAAAAPLPDAPTIPLVVAKEGRWIRNAIGPSSRFRQTFDFPGAPLAPLIAHARKEPGGWATRHPRRFIRGDLVPSERATALVLGTSQDNTPLVVDDDVPADGAPWRYRFRVADLWGRFGPALEVDVPTPARSAPPAPVLKTTLRPHHRAPGEEAALWGTIEVTVSVPTGGDLAAGARPIAKLDFSIDGEARQVDVLGEPAASFSIPIEGLAAGQVKIVQLLASFRDDLDATSEATQQKVELADPSPPRVVKTATGIVWTSRPGPAEHVELALSWPAAPGARYRVYLADAQALLERPGDADGRPRAVVAAMAVLRANAPHLRDRFRLLTDPPLMPGADGRVVLHESLPRSLSKVQVVRVVPVSERNVEQVFERCGLTPIAVPAALPPPAPRLRAEVEAASGVVRLRIEAPGLDLAQLELDEPGLFLEPPAPGARAPEYRLRRSLGTATDPLYAQEVARGPLIAERQAGSILFAADFVDPLANALPFFVPVTYWAEVRMPAERRLPTDFDEAAPGPDHVRALQPQQLLDAPGTFSLPSSPAPVLRVPEQAPQLATEQLTATRRQRDDGLALLDVQVAAGPLPSRIGSYSIKLWLASHGTELFPLAPPLELDNGTLTWTSAALSVPDDSQLFAALVDPLNRSGPVVAVAVAAV